MNLLKEATDLRNKMLDDRIVSKMAAIIQSTDNLRFRVEENEALAKALVKAREDEDYNTIEKLLNVEYTHSYGVPQNTNYATGIITNNAPSKLTFKGSF